MGPAVQGVVIAVYDVCPDAGLCKPPQSVAKSQLCPQAALSAVIDIPGHKQEIDLLPVAQLNNGIVSLESCLSQLIGNLLVRFG